MNFRTKNIIYVPTYNHQSTIFELLNKLKNINFNFDVLIIDDYSSDETLLEIKKFIDNEQHKFYTNIIKTKKNYGYAISQKIAYTIFIDQTKCDNIIMLHGDLQYDPSLINKFKKYLESDYGIIQGVRTKIAFPNEDQTPFLAYAMIKTLNYYENFICNTKFKEWHSGFVMYKRKFISKLPIHNLINSLHIDGNILYIAKLLSTKVQSIDIYKKYKKRNNYDRLAILKYVLSILYLPFYFIIKNKKFFTKGKIDYQYSIVDLKE